jgi:catechol 2,3-dioxygenase-like lactoylglutathione lyase family enzyme
MRTATSVACQDAPDPVRGGAVARSVPILLSRDLAATARFYEALGFTAARPLDDYLIVDRDGAEIHFVPAPHLEPRTSDAMCYLHVDDVDAVLEEWAAAGLPRSGIPRLTAAEDKPWGLREAALVDPDGTLVRVGSTVL